MKKLLLVLSIAIVAMSCEKQESNNDVYPLSGTSWSLQRDVAGVTETVQLVLGEGVGNIRHINPNGETAIVRDHVFTYTLRDMVVRICTEPKDLVRYIGRINNDEMYINWSGEFIILIKN